MKKLIHGILDFQRQTTPAYRETFARLAKGQSPDCLFICCSDSRVAPNVFASTNPGDLFVMRNVGNIVPISGPDGKAIGDESEAAAIEFAVNHLRVTDLVVCGHSECGAMKALLAGGTVEEAPNLTAWLRHARPAVARLKAGKGPGHGLDEHNRLSQLNVLVQLEQILSYPVVREAVAAGRLQLHGWWFEISQVQVHAYDRERREFVSIDEGEAPRLLGIDSGSGRRPSNGAANGTFAHS